MMHRKVMIVYYSETGTTEKMAYSIARPLQSISLDVRIKKVEDFETSMLTQFDAIVIGSPTYFSNIAWPIKRMIDESITYCHGGKQLKGKIIGTFTSSSGMRDALHCLKMLEIAFGLHHEMNVVKGIMRIKGESDQEAENKCMEYGRKLARAIKCEPRAWDLENIHFMRPS